MTQPTTHTHTCGHWVQVAGHFRLAGCLIARLVPPLTLLPLETVGIRKPHATCRAHPHTHTNERTPHGFEQCCCIPQLVLLRQTSAATHTSHPPESMLLPSCRRNRSQLEALARSGLSPPGGGPTLHSTSSTSLPLNSRVVTLPSGSLPRLQVWRTSVTTGPLRISSCGGCSGTCG
jgi:hypothetical protein